ncbi:hypothetical protein GCM10009117_01750 [Gangjinia marincola]|uniref:Uncharacterized protein n=1 Tax=Gangjinia marincola TaxID=578463 RepID=A0ABN1MDE6_9FLAO
MNTKQVADKLVQWCREGDYKKCYNELYHENAVSKEASWVPNNETQGRDSIIKEYEE